MKLTRYMIGYPLVTIFCWTLPTINRVSDLFSSEALSFQASQVTVYIQGFLVFLIYSKTSPALKLWKRFFRQQLSHLNLITSSNAPSSGPALSTAPGPVPSTLSGNCSSPNSFPSNLLHPSSASSNSRPHTQTTLSLDFNLSTRPLAFSSSMSREYCYGDDGDDVSEEDYEEEEYEGHRFQNTVQTRQRWVESSFHIPPILEESP
jgi:hypothetical protein